jgi:hypothetical protein
VYTTNQCHNQTHNEPETARAMFNLSNDMFPALRTQLGSPLFLVFFSIAAIAVVAIWGHRRLVREHKKVVDN